jgi:ParB family chromosome partitioning protein
MEQAKNQNIVFIPTKHLHPHPDNPRKQLGDLTELSESIKVRGIMQNLTVVPHEELDDEYTVIIGHRRLGAAKAAGLKFVPCVVTLMSEKEQLATMMLENMQRSDLTMLEQADGFQMMMNLGENVESIAEKTGISTTTVRNRLKLTRYDKERMREAELRQPTMEQYLELSKIDDVSVANECLRFIGTKNFDNEVAKAIRVQKEKKEREEMRSFLGEMCEKLEDSSYEAIKERKLVSLQTLYPPYNEDMRKIMSGRVEKYGKIYYSEGYGFTVYRDHTADDEKQTDEWAEKRRKRDDLQHRANTLFETIQDRAEQFVKTYKSKKGDYEILMDYLFTLFAMGKTNYQGGTILGTARRLGWEQTEDQRTWEESTREAATAFINCQYSLDKCRTVLTFLWEMENVKKPFYLAYKDCKLTHQPNNIGKILQLLSDLGYNVSDEEWELCDGTHPIYSETVPL